MNAWKRYILILLWVPLVAFTYGTEQDTELRDLAPFTKISVGQGIHVVLVPGDRPQVRVSTGRRVKVDQLKTEVSNGRLRISIGGGNPSDVEITVYYQTLEALRVSSTASVIGEEIISVPKFEVDVSSTGRVQARVMADVVRVEGSSTGSVQLEAEATEVYADLSSTASLEISGTADKLVADISSAAELKGYGLHLADAVLEVSSAGNAEISVSRKLEAEVSSGGSIRYQGNPTTYLKERSGGSIHNRN